MTDQLIDKICQNLFNKKKADSSADKKEPDELVVEKRVHGKNILFTARKVYLGKKFKKAIGNEIVKISVNENGIHYKLMNAGDIYSADTYTYEIVNLGHYKDLSLDEMIEWIKFFWPVCQNYPEYEKELRTNAKIRYAMIDLYQMGQSVYSILFQPDRAPPVADLVYKKDGKVKLH